MIMGSMPIKENNMTFDIRKYKKVEVGKDLDNTTLVAADDSLANRGLIIGFEHVPSKAEVKFKAFITAFNDTYNPDWSSETVYGRVDPIYLYKNTTRQISLTLKLKWS